MNTLSLSHLSESVISLPSWQQQLDAYLQGLDAFFPRKEVREQAKNYLKGLLSPVERKNGWQLAEHLGHANPYRVQHLLDRAVWDADTLRDQLARFVTDHLGAPDGILVIDESGIPKKGHHSCGVKRQYCGAAGGVDNCQVGVFVSYASVHGQTLLDRELYLPQEWTHDTERRAKTKVPTEIAFATKPQLAQKMVERAFASGLPIAWVTGDSVYGSDPALRRSLEARGQPYVLALAKDERLLWEAGRIRAETLCRRLPACAWQTLSCGEGTKGERLYAWGLVPLDAPAQEGFGYWLLVRRSLTQSTECTYYLVFAPLDTALLTMVKVAGTRWSIEVCFEQAKGEVGLDHYEVRSWHGWYRHMSLCLWAQAILVALRKEQAQPTPKGGPTRPRNSLRNFKLWRGLLCA